MMELSKERHLSNRLKLIALFLTILLCTIPFYPADAQNIKKIVANVKNPKKEKKYRGKLEQILRSEPENILANYCLSIIYARNNDPERLYEAWLLIDHASVYYKTGKNNIDITRTNTIMYNAAKKIESVKNYNDSLLYASNRNMGLDQLNSRMFSFENSRYIASYIASRNYLEYIRAVKENTIQAYNHFLNCFPDAAEIPDIVIRRDSLAYDETRKKDIVFVYNEFIATHPESKMLNQAVRIRDQKSFEIMSNTAAMEDWDYYLTQYPTSTLVDSALILREKLAYNIAVRANTIDAYQEFIRRNPSAIEIPSAIEKRDKLVFNQMQEFTDCSAYSIFMSGIPFADRAISLFLKEYKPVFINNNSH